MLSRTRRARSIATGGLGTLTLVFAALHTTILTSLAIIRPVPAYCVKPGCHGRACPR